jgi:hypothetical protein
MAEETLALQASDQASPENVFSDRPLSAGPATSNPGTDDVAVGESGQSQTDPADEIPEEFRFELLDPEQLTLTDARKKLETLSAYTPVFHGGWIQEGYPEERAKPFDLSVIDGLAPLAGTVTFYKSRFLHVRLALRYLTDSARQGGDDADRSRLDYALAEANQARYEINEARRLRSGELHLLDHPAFGVLIQITPEPEPELMELEPELPAATIESSDNPQAAD